MTLQCVRDQNVVGSVGPQVDLGISRDACDESGSAEADEDEYVTGVTHVGGYCVAAVRDLDEVRRSLGSIRNRTVTLGVLVAAVAGLIGLLAANRLTKPITRLTRAATKVAETDDLDVELPGQTGDLAGDEVQKLTGAFAHMLETLKRSRAGQQQFVQDAGHELRTPLTSVRTNVDTLLRYPDLEPAVRDTIAADIQGELDEMTSLIEELVTLGDETKVVPQSFDLGALVDRVVQTWRRRSGRSITLVVKQAATVEGRPRSIARAVSNLVDNAVKFSPPDGDVEVTVEGATVMVRDHGAGLDESTAEQLFERFHRSVDARSLPGSGLGLSIVREIVKIHGGTVKAGNHPDGGAVFQMDLGPATLT